MFDPKINIEVIEGTPGETPLLICNGLGCETKYLAPLLNALKGPTIIYFDSPGIGDSSSRFKPYRFPSLARVLSTMLSEMGHEQVDILGMSWGGFLAQEFALKTPTSAEN